MRVLPAAGHRVMPWKNGGGETREIAVWPEGAGLDAFGWRISAATVASDGPFSVFPGIDRTLAILEGAGMDLAIDGEEWQRLVKTSPPLRFSCDLPATARLVAGPVLDLNVMTRRGRFQHSMRRLAQGPLAPPSASDTIAALVCTRGRVTIRTDGGEVELGPLDCAILEGTTTAEVRFADNGGGCGIGILAAGSVAP